MGEKEDERKKGRRTMPFFLGDKVLLETWLWIAVGGWGQEVPMLLGYTAMMLPEE